MLQEERKEKGQWQGKTKRVVEDASRDEVSGRVFGDLTMLGEHMVRG